MQGFDMQDAMSVFEVRALLAPLYTGTSTWTP